MKGQPIAEYEIDPEDGLSRIEELVEDRFPKAVIKQVDRAMFATDGPVNHLAWVAYDDYERHTFFYLDDDPASQEIHRYLGWSPSREEMPKLEAYLASTYDVYETVQLATFFEIPDPYLPGSDPRALVTYYHNPYSDQFNVGINAYPPQKESEILEHVDKLVPARDLETFLKNIVRTLGSEIEAEIERHELKGDVREFLQQDTDFRKQTVRSLPADIHPEYTGDEAALWQKPASKVDQLDSAAGFVQVWVPVDTENLGLISITGGDYDRESVLNEVQNALHAEL